MTDHDLPRAFCLVKVGKNAFFSAESQDGSQAVGLHFVMCESQTVGRVFFLLCWRVRNVYLKYVYGMVIVRGGGRWLGV